MGWALADHELALIPDQGCYYFCHSLSPITYSFILTITALSCYSSIFIFVPRVTPALYLAPRPLVTIGIKKPAFFILRNK